jgi:GNAT superfamily N-acetyltransferase
MLEKTDVPVITITTCVFDPKSEEYPHILSLCKAHADELRVFSILQLNVDEARYLELQSRGKLLFLAGRDATNKIRAYSSHFIHKHPHYTQVWVGQEDTIYVEPELRRHGVGRQLREVALKELKQRGCSLVTARTKFGHEDDTNLEELGFKKWEICFGKVI